MPGLDWRDTIGFLLMAALTWHAGHFLTPHLMSLCPLLTPEACGSRACVGSDTIRTASAAMLTMW